jgi:hypothetical protein
MLSVVSTMSAPASMTIEMAPVVIWALIALFVIAALGVVRAVWVARQRTRIEAAELESLARLARRFSESADATGRPLAA